MPAWSCSTRSTPHERGAEIATRTELLSARRDGDAWTATLSGGRTVAARMIVNAAGPWVAETLNRRLETEAESRVRLIKGSHIIVPRLWEGDHAYILQQGDGRVVFALPYGERSLIGTTDVPVASPEEAVDHGRRDRLSLRRRQLPISASRSRPPT